jgi:hypothetical protein
MALSGLHLRLLAIDQERVYHSTRPFVHSLVFLLQLSSLHLHHVLLLLFATSVAAASTNQPAAPTSKARSTTRNIHCTATKGMFLGLPEVFH